MRLLTRGRPIIGSLVWTAAVLALASPAAGQSCAETPGGSAVDQYCESVPEPGGNSGPNDQPGGGSSGPSGGGGTSGGSGGGTGDGGLSSATQRSLESAGADGASVLRLIGTATETSTSGDRDRTTGGGSASDAKRGRGSGSSGRFDSEATPSNNPLGAVSSAVEDGASSGPVFIWVLIGLGLLLAAVTWLRYRSTRGASR